MLSAVTFSGCWPSAAPASQTAETIISSGSAVYPNGCTVTAPGQPTTRWPGRVYILPAPTYRALFLAE